MKFFACVKWAGRSTAIQASILCALAVAGLVMGALVLSALWRPTSYFARLPKLQAAWIGIFMLVSSLGLLLVLLPPLFGYNRCT